MFYAKPVTFRKQSPIFYERSLNSVRIDLSRALWIDGKSIYLQYTKIQSFHTNIPYLAFARIHNLHTKDDFTTNIFVAKISDLTIPQKIEKKIEKAPDVPGNKFQWPHSWALVGPTIWIFAPVVHVCFCIFIYIYMHNSVCIKIYVYIYVTHIFQYWDCDI